MGLTDEARSYLESNIDMMLSDPDWWERNISNLLQRQGIEATLETILSYISGMLGGHVDGFYQSHYSRKITNDEWLEFDQIMKRRAWEIRQAFISTRIKE